MKLLGITLIVILICSISVQNIYGITKEEAAKQLQERENALKKIQEDKKNQKPTTPRKTVNVLTLQLDNTCLTLVKNNKSSNCPTYEELSIFDTTDQKTAGKFVKTSWYHREKQFDYNWPALIKPDQLVVCVDCILPQKSFEKYSITIVQKLNYVLKQDLKVKDNILISHKDRYVENCKNAKIIYSPGLLNDTINYLKSGCKDTQYQTKIETKQKLSEITRDGPHYQYLKWLEEAKKLKTKNCIKSTEC